MEEAQMDPSQDQESLCDLLLDGGQQHFNTKMVQGKYTPLSLGHFHSAVPWIACLHSRCLSTRVHLQENRDPQFQRFRAFLLSLDELSHLPKRSALSEEMHPGLFKADRTPLEWKGPCAEMMGETNSDGM